ncbi:hypothetical protein Tco_1418498 [Tanacetum coccineum]
MSSCPPMTSSSSPITNSPSTKTSNQKTKFHRKTYPVTRLIDLTNDEVNADMAKNSDEVFRVYVKGIVSDAREKHVFEVKKGFLVEVANGGEVIGLVEGLSHTVKMGVSISTPRKCQEVCSDLLEPIVTSKAPNVFNCMPQPHTMQFTNITETSSKDGLTIIECKRGGDVFSDSHSNWLQKVSANPEAMLFKFVPITSLLYRGADILVMRSIYIYAASHSNKPTLEDLQCFLEFQVPRLWAPIFCELPLWHQRRKTSCPRLQFSFMGPKIYISTTQVLSDDKPVTGLRLFLEGKKCNRLTIHVQHLSSLPDTITHTLSKYNITCRPFQLRSSDEYDSKAQFLDPFRWKRYSNICSSVVKRDPNWLNQEPAGGASAPAVARKSSLFTIISSTFTFTQRSVANVQKQQQPATLNSGVFPDSPPVQVRSTKLRKYLDTDEVLELYVTLTEKLHRLAVELVADVSGVESVKITCTSSRETDDLDTPLVRNLVAKVSEFGEIQLHGRVKDGVPHLTKVSGFEVDVSLEGNILLCRQVDQANTISCVEYSG